MNLIPVFDLGNVIIQVDFEPFLQWLAQNSEVKDQEKLRALLSSSLFYELEFGSITPVQFRERLARLYRGSFSQADLEEKFCAIFPGIVSGMDLVLQELKQIAPVYCLSNTNSIHLNHCLNHFPITSEFHRIFASHNMNMRKPDPEIYKKVAEELGVSPSSIVYFDDLPGNIEGALKSGMQAHVFSNSEQTRDILQLGRT